MKDGERIEVIEEPDDELREAIYLPLREHNQSSSPVHWEKRGLAEHDSKPVNLFLFSKVLS